MLGNKIKNQKSKIKNTNQKLNIFKTFCFLALAFHLAFFPLSFSFSEEQFIYDSKGKRNPFIPLVTPDGRLLNLDKDQVKGDLSVEGIIYDKQGSSFAIVNGSVVVAGDTIGDYQVLKIEEDKVFFLKQDQIIGQEIYKKSNEDETYGTK